VIIITIKIIYLIKKKKKRYKVLCSVMSKLRYTILVEDINLSIKKSGFRNDEYIKKLEIVKELFENHYV